MLKEIIFKPIFRVLDLVAFIVLALGFPAWCGLAYFHSHIFRPSKESKKRKILFFVAEASYKALKEKGVLPMISDREEGGYFDMVYSIHPFVSPTQTIRISDKNILIEYGTERYDGLRKSGFKYTALLLVSWGLLSFSTKLIRKENISIVRSTAPHPAGLIGLICSKLTGVPFCVSIHADYDQRYKISAHAPVYFGSRKLAKKLERFVLSHARMVMPIRESLAKYAINYGAKPEAIRVIPHGIDLAPFLKKPDMELKKELGIEGKKVISFVGRLAPDNYVKDVVEIASQVCQRQKDAVFLMVGDGGERENLEQLSDDLGLNRNVKFLGYQPWHRVAQIRLVSDVSLCLMAGFTLIEAAAAGTPMVAYDVEWHYELVRNNETGFLVPEGDIEGATNAIITLLDSPEFAQRLGENARKLAIERHSLENTSKIKVKWYEELLKAGKQGYTE